MQLGTQKEGQTNTRQKRRTRRVAGYTEPGGALQPESSQELASVNAAWEKPRIKPWL